MSFTINLQHNLSEKNVINKNISDVISLSGTLRQGTSWIDPVIQFKTDSYGWINLWNVNYMYIQMFNRYYFVNDIKSVHNDYWEIHAHVDVLQSFKNEILNNNAVVHRQENNYNLYLDDGIFKTYQNPMVITKAFPSGFSGESFILAVAGN